MSKSRRGAATVVAAVGMTSVAIAPAPAREVVRYNDQVQPGTIVVKTAERRLYLVLGDGTAIRYPVAVGRPGKQWQGWGQVTAKFVQPAWTPPDEIRHDNPKLPEVIPGGSSGRRERDGTARGCPPDLEEQLAPGRMHSHSPPRPERTGGRAGLRLSFQP